MINHIPLFLIGVGVVGAVMTISFFSLASPYFKSQLRKKSVIRNGSDTMDMWMQPKVPIYLTVYFFQVENIEEVVQGTNKPNLTEKGPYVFSEKRSKTVLNITQDENLIFYEEDREYFFDPVLSAGNSLDDNITVLNFPVIAAVSNTSSSYDGVFKRLVLDQIFTNTSSELFEVHSVRKLLFDGFQISFIEELNKRLKEANQTTLPTLTSFMYKKNHTSDGVYSIFTGSKDIDKLMEIQSWKGNSRLDTWPQPNSTCNMINGTDGSGFHPFLGKDSVIQVFVPKLCRSFPMHYDHTDKVKDISTNRYTPPKEALESPEKNPENACFCYEKDTDKCVSGILDLSVCMNATGLYGSLPHFLHGDSSLINSSEGLRPNVEKHGTYLYLEPMTGKTFKAIQRVQISILVKPYDEVSLLKKVEKRFLPLLWFEESFELNDKLANDFKSKVTKRIANAYTLLMVGFAVSIVAVIGGFAIHLKKARAGRTSL